MFISVDLPAPFAPMRAWASPPQASRLASRRTATPANAFEMPSMRRTVRELFISPPLSSFDGNERNNHSSFDDEAEIVRHTDQVHRIRQNSNQHCPEHRSGHPSGSAVDTDAAHHTSRNDIKHHAIIPHVCGGGPESRRQKNRVQSA